MILTAPELIAALQHESRILVHLAGKATTAEMRNYRPTPTQRSTEELVRYMSVMGPTLVKMGLSESLDFAVWGAATAAAAEWDYDRCVAEIESHAAQYDALLGSVPDETFRTMCKNFQGQELSRGAFLVSLVLAGCAAYRTQLFCYLKACGLTQLTSSNLWGGMDAPQPA